MSMVQLFFHSSPLLSPPLLLLPFLPHFFHPLVLLNFNLFYFLVQNIKNKIKKKRNKKKKREERKTDEKRILSPFSFSAKNVSTKYNKKDCWLLHKNNRKLKKKYIYIYSNKFEPHLCLLLKYW